MMFSSPSAVGFALKTLLVSSVALAQDAPPSNYAERFPNGLHVLDSGVNGGLNGLSTVSYQLSRWGWGTIPQNCQDVQVANNYCNPYDIEVYELKYSDVCASTTLFGVLDTSPRGYSRLNPSIPCHVNSIVNGKKMS